jgi:hypothetical protein
MITSEIDRSISDPTTSEHSIYVLLLILILHFPGREADAGRQADLWYPCTPAYSYIESSWL